MDQKPKQQGASREASAFPTEDQLDHWTMRNNSQEFDAEQALAAYKRNEAQFNAAIDEFLDNF